MSDGVVGSDWSETEIDLIVADYFDMLRLELAGQKFNKLARNTALQALTRRTHGSIEFKHQNISAVLYRLGLPWIAGYKPMRNIQNALVPAVGRFLAAAGKWLLAYGETASPAADPTDLLMAPAPKLTEHEAAPSPLRRLVRKYDPAERDARNRSLGKLGEELVLRYERKRLLAAGRHDLERKLEWTSVDKGDGAGYDIHSFELNGSDRLIEVKTTNGPPLTPFYLSENERAFSEERPEAFCLVRVHDFQKKPGAFELRPPLDKRVKLSPLIYRARF